MTTQTFIVRTGTADASEIERHLRACDHMFHPPLSSRISIAAYAAKLASKAYKAEAWNDGQLVGLVACYRDAESGEMFISNVSVLESRTGQGIATQLMQKALNDARLHGCTEARLEVSTGSIAANLLYRKLGFLDAGEAASAVGHRILKKSI